MTEYCCPCCLGELQADSGGVTCGQCRKVYRERDGIPLFAENKEFYYGELPQEKMALLIKEAAEKGWQPAFQELLKLLPEHKKAEISQYAMDGTRAAWKYLLDLKPGGKALDFGCGWSNISVCLSRSFGEVYGMDLTWERLKFLSMKAKALGRKNIKTILGGDTPHFPFKDNFFDLVVLNGVLEWVPESRKGDPREVQKALLKEIRRILKPDGQLYVGIENRVGFLYFMGQPEDHTGLPFGSLMPRPLQNIYSKVKRGRPYRTYIYSKSGYQKLMRESGFPEVKLYSPVPDYRDFHQIIDLAPGAKQDLNPFFDTAKFKHKVKHRLYGSHTFNPSFSIVGSQSNTNSLVADLTAELGERLHSDARSYRLAKYLVSRTNNVILIYEARKEKIEPLVVKLPLNERADERTANHALAIGAVRDCLSEQPELATLVPTPLLTGTLKGHKYYAEAKLSGESGDQLGLRPRVADRLMGEAFEFITNLHLTTGKKYQVDEAIAKQQWGNALEKIIGLAREAELKDFFRALGDYLDRQLRGKSVNLVRTHGDFWLGNLLAKPPRSKLTGVIDWDISQTAGWPLLDLWHLVGYTMKLRRNNISLGKMYLEIIWPADFSNNFSGKINQYQKELALPDELLPPLKVCYWLNYLSEYMEYFLYVDSYWERENLHQVRDFLAKTVL